MLPSPAEKQELLLQWLDGMPPVEHERFLGNWLYLLVQVHHICSLSLTWSTTALHRDPPLLCFAGGGSGGSRRKAHRHAPRAGRGPDSAPALLPRDGARPRGRRILAVVAHTRPSARFCVWCRSYWIKSRRRKGCLILHTPPTATTNPTRPTPILAPSQLTVSRHVVPTRVRELKESSCILLIVRRRKRPPSS